MQPVSCLRNFEKQSLGSIIILSSQILILLNKPDNHQFYLKSQTFTRHSNKKNKLFSIFMLSNKIIDNNIY